MKKLTVLLLCLLITFTSGSAEAAPKRYQAEFLSLFDTVTTVVGYAGSKEEFTSLAEDVRAKLWEYHRLYDVYNNYDGLNNLKTINDNAGIKPVAVDARIIDLLEFAREKYALTDGAVNIAMGSVLRLWHDCRVAGILDPESAALPDMDALRAAARHTDINSVVIDRAASSVFLRDPLMRLDVGAVAKGYATEQTARYLEQKGVRRLLLSVGGNIRAIGNKLDQYNRETPWVVGVRNPDRDSGQTELLSVRCTNEALVTSGGYERYFTVGGRQYHHIIDPETLMPSARFKAVTILCHDSGFADGLTTAVFNMPLTRGRALIDSLAGVEALWVLQDGTLVTSSGFDAHRAA
ncbi:thiamine biosynthesis lipoprotein [Sporobacter termitidis DSM 10068]|uniref:FAD:protein FMN transferase n=1 Tax=Sporobacter termitidis DSM 10068 TaxID=1123282 RepID=A0A1M5XQT7_9FIRM|nr:FAD:protein FMN transferase [Sporobacter termitidis]SHI02181.1 thiamine biosynthesis lipoprotein [Sporobacter termitidis DSM 10068]